MSEYIFTQSISDELIRQKLLRYHLGLLKITKLTSDIKQFIIYTYKKYRVEGE